MERTSLYRAIAPLERDGLVVIEADADDARARRASLTPAGHERIRVALPYWQSAQRAFIDGFGARTYGRFADDLRRAIAQGEPHMRGRADGIPGTFGRHADDV